MATKTTNYGLEKPDGTDFYDVDVQNSNMDIIDKFGKIVGNKALHDPENARRLLLAGYRLQEKRLLLFPDKQLPSSGQYVARVVMKNIIKALASLSRRRWSAFLFRENF